MMTSKEREEVLTSWRKEGEEENSWMKKNNIERSSDGWRARPTERSEATEGPPAAGPGRPAGRPRQVAHVQHRTAAERGREYLRFPPLIDAVQPTRASRPPAQSVWVVSVARRASADLR